jgi:hypothetical protein
MILENATCARLPASGLASLAGLRRNREISVVLDGEHAWVWWVRGDIEALRAVLPVAGVELYERQGDAWHRAGQRLPSFQTVPPGDPVPLAGAVTPEPFAAEPPRWEPIAPLPLRLWRDGRPRPTSAALCPLVELGRWAESAPSSEIGAIRGAILGDSALLIGRSLPAWRDSTRYWGGQWLVPIGFEVRPSLPESTLIEAFGDAGRDLLRVVPEEGGAPEIDGLSVVVEAIPLEAFRPLTRAGVRLAMVGISTS